MTANILPLDETLHQAGSLAFAMIRFAGGAAHPSRGSHPPGVPHLGRDVYIFAPAYRTVPIREGPAFLASLPSPAMLMPTTTQGIVALLLLDELSGERAAVARAQFENQTAGLELLVSQLALADDATVLVEFDDETLVVSLAAVRVWAGRFLIDIGWNIALFEHGSPATARIGLFRSDGVDSPPRKPGRLLVTSDVPIVYHSDAEMVLSALRRHVPAVMEGPAYAETVHVWLMLDESGRMERTSVSLESPGGNRNTYGAVLLEPFPGEVLSEFESAGSIFIPVGYGSNTIAVKWLQRRADVVPDVAHGIYQFDAQRLLPPRATLEHAVQEHYPAYARVGLTETVDAPAGSANAAFDSDPDPGIVPWFIADADAAIMDTWLGPMLQNPLMARQLIEKRRPDLRFTSVRIGTIRTENGSWPPIVWATLDPIAPSP